MKFIIIKKSGKIIKQSIDNGKEVNEEVKSLADYLGAELEFEKGVTLKTIFKLLSREKAFFNKLYKQELGEKKLEDFDKQLQKKQTDSKNKNEDGDIMKSLEITKMFELFNFEKGSTIDLFAIFIGIGLSENEPGEVFMPVSLIPINNLKNYEVVINKAVEIFKSSPMDENGENVESLLIAASSMSVYEAFQAIIYEIAYFGTAEEKIKERKKIEEDYKLEDRIFELESNLSMYVENEEYEKAAKIKKELEMLNK